MPRWWTQTQFALTVDDVTLDDGPLDPFFGDPADPAALLADESESPGPLSDSEHAQVIEDLRELADFRDALEPLGVLGICVECADCGEQHYFGWDLMVANLRSLLGEGRTQVHEPAYDPATEYFVSWDYARGYTDAVQSLPRRR